MVGLGASARRNRAQPRQRLHQRARNEWNNAFYNALQAFNSGKVLCQLGNFCVLVAFAIAMSVYALYLNQMLQIRWRRWLTRRYLGAWLAGRAYFRLQQLDTTDT